MPNMIVKYEYMICDC